MSGAAFAAGAIEPDRLDLADLLTPMSEARFFREIFERSILHGRAREPARFSRLRAAIALPQLIDDQTGWGNVSLARADRSAASCPYLCAAPSYRVIEQAYRDGYTVVLNDLQRRVDAVAWLCRRLERSFFCRANVNLYWSPPGQAALLPHYDDDDVIILQLEGNKLWKSYPARDRLPTGRSAYHLGDLGDPGDHELLAGDILYLPRGTPHEALAVGAGSMHLTVSLNLVRWSEVMAEIVGELAERDLACRRSVPREMLRSADRDLGSIGRALLSRVLAGPGDTGEAAHNIHRRLLETAPRLALQKRYEDGERYRLAPDQLCAVTWTEAEVRLVAIGTSCSFHPRWSDLCRRLAGGDDFDRAELASMGTDAEISEILEALLASGVIVRVCAPKPRRRPQS